MGILRILLLEDSLLDAELIQANLINGGMECNLLRVETQADFMAALHRETFDLILSDYSLPGFDGISALNWVRHTCPEVPFIFVSATLGEELAIETLKTGATDYVLKQRLERLPLSVERALREAQERRDRQQAEAALRQSEAQLRQQAASLEEANRLKDEFLAVLSHELRSPLNPILGWTQVLRSRKLDEATTTRALETIERNAKLQSQLIEDLLDISRIIQGKLTLHPCPIHLKVPIEAAIETMRLAAEAKSIHIQSCLDLTTGLVSGDPNRLQQIVLNLLSNAIKFTPDGGRVEVHLKEMDSYAQIQVQDTGRGISTDFLPHVFEYFRQADSSTTRTHGGLGLGLAITRRLVELHSGTVEAASPGVDQGATFTVNLPLMHFHAVTHEIKQSFVNVLDIKDVRVLVVDDEPDMRAFITFVLEQYGAKAMAVASASEVIEVLEQFQPHVLVSDIGMPGEDGYALLHRVRTWERGRSLSLEQQPISPMPAIALTAYAREEDRIHALSVGFQIHLAKPVEPLELVTMVRRLAGQSEGIVPSVTT
ncbi:MAG: response regulator [Leptolyngbyaceae bacterium]|nr:response regulator [Leptolyngbyaceae bacterium]